MEDMRSTPTLDDAEPSTKGVGPVESPSGAKVDASTPPSKEQEGPDDFQSLLKAFDDDDDGCQPAEPALGGCQPLSLEGGGGRASCPAGAPSPKFNPISLQRSKGVGADEAVQSVARLFGGDASVVSARPDEEGDVRCFQIPEEKPPPEPKKPPFVVVWLDSATETIRQKFPWLPSLLGWAGVVMIANGAAMFLLARMGWI